MSCQRILAVAGAVCITTVAISSKALASAGSGTRLVATVAPVCTVQIQGAKSQTLPAGRYRVLVRDTSSKRYFRLVGRGVNRTTGKAFVGSVTWRVALARGSYRFECAKQSRTARGTLTVS
jgi:hypothetical protein